jgi:hypothetical protein
LLQALAGDLPVLVQPREVRRAVLDGGLLSPQAFERLLGGGDLELRELRAHLEQVLLVDGAQVLELARVALLERCEELRTEALHGARVLLRLLDQVAEAIRRDIARSRAQYIVDREPGRDHADEQARIDLRREQRERPPHARDVHAVADLHQAILDAIPVREEILVRRDAEHGLLRRDHRQRIVIERRRSAFVAVAIDAVGILQIVERVAKVELAVRVGELAEHGQAITVGQADMLRDAGVRTEVRVRRR